jgi:hypothetical protein
MTAGRDLARETRFLTEGARGDRPFIDDAQARLAAGEDTFGDSWMWIGIRRHLTELLEEAADLGAWGCLAEQALERENDLSDLHREQIRAVLTTAAHCGAQAHAALTRARTSLEKYGVGGPSFVQSRTSAMDPSHPPSNGPDENAASR